MTNEELVERIRAGENVPENMAALYDQTRGFIHSLVWKYRESGIMEDLEQEGFLALYPAIENYDPTAGVKFLTYAGFWIRQRIGRYMADNSSLHLPVFFTCTICGLFSSPSTLTYAINLLGLSIKFPFFIFLYFILSFILFLNLCCHYTLILCGFKY